MNAIRKIDSASRVEILPGKHGETPNGHDSFSQCIVPKPANRI